MKKGSLWATHTHKLIRLLDTDSSSRARGNNDDVAGVPHGGDSGEAIAVSAELLACTSRLTVALNATAKSPSEGSSSRVADVGGFKGLSRERAQVVCLRFLDRRELQGGAGSSFGENQRYLKTDGQQEHQCDTKLHG